MTTTLPAGWKPIESAPRDGTPVLLFARHINAEASTRVVGAYHYDYGWLSQAYSGQGMAQLVASHWMELPPFPDTPPASSQDTITVSLDPDPRGVSVGVWQGSRCIYNGAHAVPASAQDDAKDEMSAVHAAFDRGYGTALDHVARARAAPAAGDARDDLTLNQKYEDACILANANARDAGRYRVVRKSIVDEANGSNQVAAASEAIGLERGAYPTPDQFDAIVDHIAAQQGKGGE